jgi:hypothetical protein
MTCPKTEQTERVRAQKYHNLQHGIYGIFATLAKNHSLNSLSTENKPTFKHLQINGTGNSDFKPGDFVYPLALGSQRIWTGL